MFNQWYHEVKIYSDGGYNPGGSYGRCSQCGRQYF